MITSQLSRYCDVISNRLWRHQQNEDRGSETQGRCVKIVVLASFMDTLCRVRKKNNVCTRVTNCFRAHASVTSVYFQRCSCERWNSSSLEHIYCYLFIQDLNLNITITANAFLNDLSWKYLSFTITRWCRLMATYLCRKIMIFNYIDR